MARYYKQPLTNALVMLQDDISIHQAFVNGSSYVEIPPKMISNFEYITYVYYGNSLKIMSETYKNDGYKENIIDFITEKRKRRQ